MDSSKRLEHRRLSLSEIATLLEDFQIASVTERDLINPNPDLIADLYTRLLIHLVFLEEENEQLDFEALAHFDNPEYHDVSIHAMKQYNMIKAVLAALKCPRDFTLADLLTPDTQRTELFLGAFLKYTYHRVERLDSIAETGDALNNLEEERVELQETLILQVKSDISNFNEAKERDMVVIQELDAKVAELHNTIKILNKNQMSMKTTLKKLKDKTEEMDAKIANAEFTLSQSAQENGNLSSKIPQSPDKVQRDLGEKKLAREEARKAERLAKQFLHEKTALLEIYSKVYKIMSKHYNQMQAIKDQVNSAKSVEKKLKALKAKLSDEEVLEMSLEAKLVEGQSKVVHMEELKKQLENERTIKWEESTKYLSSTRSEVESKKCDVETKQRNVMAVDAMNSKIRSAEESGAAKVELLGHKRKAVAEEFEKFANSIGVIESGPKRQRLNSMEGCGFRSVHLR